MAQVFENKLAEYLYKEIEADKWVGSATEGVGWAGLFFATHSQKIHIVEETPDGLVAVFTHPEGESVVRWAETEERLSMDGDEPEEGDYVVQQSPDGYVVSQYGHSWEFPDCTAVDEFLGTHMEKNGFFPNLWHVSDHGNYTTWEMEQPA